MGTSAKRLRKARRIRHRMSSELEQLASGRIHIENVLRNPSDALGRCRIYDVLRRTPKLGDQGSRRLLETHNIWPEDRLAAVPPEKRGVLIASLPDRAKSNSS